MAFVFKPDFLATETDAFGAYSHPVSYLNRSQFAAAFSKIASDMLASMDFVRKLAPLEVENAVFSLLLWSAVATKHPAFAEEREWRVVAIPPMWPSKILIQSVEVIRGIPQPVLKLPFRNFPEHNVAGLTIPDLLDRVIIGPCEHPDMLRRAMTDLLISAGVQKPSEKIIVSGIPLRQ